MNAYGPVLCKTAGSVSSVMKSSLVSIKHVRIRGTRGLRQHRESELTLLILDRHLRGRATSNPSCPSVRRSLDSSSFSVKSTTRSFMGLRQHLPPPPHPPTPPPRRKWRASRPGRPRYPGGACFRPGSAAAARARTARRDARHSAPSRPA